MLKRVLQFIALSLLALAAPAAPTFPSAANPVRLHCTLVIRMNTYETMFVVRNGDSDGPADHIFRVWNKPTLQIDGGYRGAEVEFVGASLIVTLPVKRTVLVFTAKDEVPPALTPQGFSMTGYIVVGLNHETGNGAARHVVKNGGVTPMLDCVDSCDQYGFEVPDPWNYNAANCYSGGADALTCSQANSFGSCMVTCKTGTACCTNPALSPPKRFCIK